MKLLVIGSGAREHALAWAAAKGRHSVFCAPGNAGTAGLARNLPLDPMDPAAIIEACREFGIDLVLPGPEQPLAAGMVDALAEAGIAAFGPRRKTARLEASKAEGRAFAGRWGIPCPATRHFSPGRGVAELIRYLDENRGKRLVLKKSGMASGKGVVETEDTIELRAFGEAVLATDELLAEEFLSGRELSVFALCTENGYRLLDPAVDHKKALAGDRGPNTGGMGAVSPVPFADSALMARIEKEIVVPTFEGLAREGLSFRGMLFLGLMVTAEGPRLLSYNLRFGDPETQALLPRLEGDLASICSEVAAGRIPELSFSPQISCGVVVAAPGYPIAHPRGLTVELSGPSAPMASGKPEAESSALPDEGGPSAFLFQAATGRDQDGGLRTGAGRSFTAVGLGADWKTARDRAYRLAASIHFEGAWFRPDIGESVYGK